MLHARGAAAPARTGNRHGGLGISPYNAYKTSDGHVVLNAPGDQHFRSILDVIDRPDLKDDPRFATRSARVAHMLAVDELLEAWTSTHSKDEVAQKMLAASVPCAPVRELSEVIVDDNMHERGSLQWFDHPELGRVVLPHSPLRFEGLPLMPLVASAPLGNDNRRVFGDWLGLDDKALEDLARDGVI
jgi:formyl-CoA transferase